MCIAHTILYIRTYVGYTWKRIYRNIFGLDLICKICQLQLLPPTQDHTTYSGHNFNSPSLCNEKIMSITKASFPHKLFHLLKDAEDQSKENIVSWLPSGNGFKVFKEQEFCDQLMSKYFKQSKFKSFTRQVSFAFVFSSSA